MRPPLFLTLLLLASSSAFGHWEIYDCNGALAYSTEVRNWRDTAILAIRAGLDRSNLNPHAVIDMSPFIPAYVKELVEPLPHGMVGLFDHPAMDTIFGNPNYLTDEQRSLVPERLWIWTRKIAGFISDLVMEALRPMTTLSLFVKQSSSVSKVAIGGTAQTFVDHLKHTDGNSLVTVILNALGDLGTHYYLRGSQQLLRSGDSSYEERVAPPFSLLILPGEEFSNSRLGPAMFHNTGNVDGLSYRIVQFIDFRFVNH